VKVLLDENEGFEATRPSLSPIDWHILKDNLPPVIAALDHFQDFRGPVERVPGGASFSLQPSASASAF
jgi:hypothetical protein